MRRKLYEADAYLTYNNEVILVEQKSVANDSDIYNFQTNSRAYEIITGKKPYRKVSGCINPEKEALKVAKEYGIEVVPYKNGGY